MIAKSIIDSDAFLDMPMSARLLYYDLNMRADDDGFVNGPKKIMRMVGATWDDMKILIARKFVIYFESEIIVIKHWRIHNYIRRDTYKETNYKEEKSMLEFDENKAYRLASQRVVDGPSTQDRIGKDSIGYKEKEIYKEKEAETPSEISCLVETVSESNESIVDNPKDSIPYSKILDYLNTKANRSFQNVHGNRRLIKARFNEGYTEQDFYKVIDTMCERWINTEYEEYLQPTTLFGNKFDKYLNKPKLNKKSEDDVVYDSNVNKAVSEEELAALRRFRE